MHANLAVSVVIPVFNSEASLEPLVQRLERVLVSDVRRFEVILVDDGSRDRSWGTITELAQKHSFVRGIRLMRNYGQHNALLCGVRAACHEIIVTMDDDLQNPPEEISRLLDHFSSGYDVVYGSPQTERHGFWRVLASKVTKVVLQGAMGAESARAVSAFRVFRTELRDSFQDYAGPYPSLDALLTWGTSAFGVVTVRHEARHSGKSNYTLASLLRHAASMMTGFSTIPLRLASVVGFIFTGLGGLLLVYVLVRYLAQGAAVPGFAFLASTVVILSGAQLFALGIMGEYLARMHLRLMNRPTYTVSRRTDQKDAADGSR